MELQIIKKLKYKNIQKIKEVDPCGNLLQGKT